MSLECHKTNNSILYTPKKISKKEKMLPLIEPGSVNKLANLLIPVLSNKGLTFSSIEDSATLGEIISALTIVGSGRIINRSIIAPNMRKKFGKLLHSTKNGEPNDDIKKLVNATLSKNSDKKNNVVLATLGDFNNGDRIVKIGLKFGDKRKFISLTEDDFIKTVKNIVIDEDNLLSIQKQFVADRALRLLLNELKIDTSSINFKPQIEEKVILNKSKKETIKYLSLFLKGRKISTVVESATGGYIAKTLSDVEEGKDLLHSSMVLYKTEEKIEAGILEEALLGDNLYGRATALALAEIAKKHNGKSIVIGVTGLLDTGDTRLSYKFRKPGIIYYTIIIPGHEIITEKIHLPKKSRLEMKAGLTLMIFQRLLQVLVQDELASS